MTTVPLAMKGLNVSCPVAAAAIPRDFPLEGPAPEVRLELTLEGHAVPIVAPMAGKTFRKAVKALLAAEAAGGAVVLLQGSLRAAPGGGLVLESAGLAVKPKPAAPAEATTGGEA
jgi:hypothetical protein